MASPFSLFQKNQRFWMAMLVILAIVSFVILPSVSTMMDSRATYTGETAVRWRSERFSERDVIELSNTYGTSYAFLRRLALEVVRRGGSPSLPGGYVDAQTVNLGLPEPNNVDDAINIYFAAREAERLGIRVDEKTADLFIQQLCDNRISQTDYRQILRETAGGDLDDYGIRRYLTDAIAASLLNQVAASSVAYAGNPLMPPAGNWQNFKRFEERAQIEALPLVVDDFLAKVTKTPTGRELQQLYDEGITRFPNPDSPEPGFRRPYAADFESISGTVAQFIDQAKAEVTDEQIRTTYETNLINGRYALDTNTPAAAAAPSVDRNVEEKPEEASPAAQEPSANSTTDEAPTDGEPTDNEPTDNEPTDNEPTDGEPTDGEPTDGGPTDDKPADETAPAEKPAADQPEEDKPAIEEQPTAEQPAGEQPAAEQPAAEQPAPEQPAEEKSEAEETAVEETTGDQSRIPTQSAVRLVAFQAEANEEPEQETAPEVAQATPENETAETEPAADAPADAGTDESEPAAAAAASAETTNQPAETTPAAETAPPAETTPAAETAPAGEPAKRNRSLEEVRDEIVQELAQPIALEKLQAALQTVDERVDEYREALEYYNAIGKSDGEKPPTPLDAPALADELGLTYQRTGLLDPVSAFETELGRTLVGQINLMGMAQFATTLITPELPKYEPVQSQTFALGGDRKLFASWKVDERLEFAPAFTEIEEEVEAAYKLIQARELAAAEATSLADQLRSGGDWASVLDETRQALVVQPSGFTFLVPGMQGQISRSSVDKIGDVSEEFMRNVFNSKPGEYATAPDIDHSHYYVIKVLDFSPPEEELRTRFAASSFNRSAQMLSAQEMTQVMGRFISQLQTDANLQTFQVIDR